MLNFWILLVIGESIALPPFVSHENPRQLWHGYVDHSHSFVNHHEGESYKIWDWVDSGSVDQLPQDPLDLPLDWYESISPEFRALESDVALTGRFPCQTDINAIILPDRNQRK
jgi:hypothetical protein